MKLIVLYLGAMVAFGAALAFYNDHALNPAERLSDLALCEAQGRAYFIDEDPQAYKRILTEIDKRKESESFTINSRSCGLFGLASAVNSLSGQASQTELALTGMRQFMTTLSHGNQTITK